MATLTVGEVEGEVALRGRMKPSLINRDFAIYLPETVVKPPINFEAELRWYIEDYAGHDPFSFRRAQSISIELESYGSSLAQSMCDSDAELEGLCGKELMILIDDSDSYSPRLSRIHWEILERLELWRADCRPRNVTVLRLATLGNRTRESKSQSHVVGLNRQSHLLAVSARVSSQEEIPYRLITRAIFNSLSERDPTDAPTFEIVRPGTLEALRTSLESKADGYYNVVHFDVHGHVEDGQLVKLTAPSVGNSGLTQWQSIFNFHPL